MWHHFFCLPLARHFPQEVFLSYLAPEQTRKMFVACKNTHFVVEMIFKIVSPHTSTVHKILVCEKFVNATNWVISE